ncbi:MAG TPA: (2Fe-2S) ferredoxin domain-containing protein [Candidatus Polarisedimenticolia bacterium]|nr:(2Fe-2S) ferredoxin domain-containing protein [Candidatus Polarisedimenticolia bacterium]
MAEQTRLIYVCEGGDCSEKGSVELYEDLKTALHEKDPEGRNKLRKYPCFGGCAHGINVVVYPDRCFYSKVTTGDLPEIVDHLMGDGPKVERLTGKVEKDVEQFTYDLLTTGF